MNNLTELTMTRAPDLNAGPGIEQTTHVLSAVYPGRDEAEGVRQLLEEQGISATEMRIFHETPPQPGDVLSDDVLKDVLVDGGIGTLMGTGVGALGALAIVASGITLFVASPVVAPLAMLGWFAGIGGIVGAAVGANRKDGRFSELVTDAIQAGNTVLVVRTHAEPDRELVRVVLEASFRGREGVTTESA